MFGDLGLGYVNIDLVNKLVIKILKIDEVT